MTKYLFGLSILLIFFLLSCGDISSETEDKDSTAPAAVILPPNMDQPDRIDAENGDKVDWKKFSYFADATVTIRFIFGSIGQSHNLVGSIKIFDINNQMIASEPIQKSKNSYAITFDAKAKQTYFIKLEVSEGSCDYIVRADVVKKVVDPCEKCTASEKCIDGKCIPLDECYPKCKPNEECVEGVCKAKKIKCPAGHFWSKYKKKCVKNPCWKKKCPVGMYCKYGKCVPKKTTKKCFPPCKKGEFCDPKSHKCKPVPAKGKVVGKVLNFWAGPSGGTILLINKGKKHHLKKGMKGILQNGGKAVIIEVYPYRCKAKVNLPMKKFRTNMTITFKL